MYSDFIQRPQLLHITTVGVHKAKARMNPPANDTEQNGEGGTHRHAAMAQNAMYSILYLYIYLYHIYKTTVRPKQMPDISFYTITEQRLTNFLIKKIFLLFSL